MIYVSDLQYILTVPDSLPGDRKFGEELLFQATSLHEQSYGFLHPETAKCYSALAMCSYHNDDLVGTLDFQRKATVIFERTLGVDSAEAVHGYVG